MAIEQTEVDISARWTEMSSPEIWAMFGDSIFYADNRFGISNQVTTQQKACQMQTYLEKRRKRPKIQSWELIFSIYIFFVI